MVRVSIYAFGELQFSLYQGSRTGFLSFQFLLVKKIGKKREDLFHLFYCTAHPSTEQGCKNSPPESK
jgi:hypothetical protein